MTRTHSKSNKNVEEKWNTGKWSLNMHLNRFCCHCHCPLMFLFLFVLANEESNRTNKRWMSAENGQQPTSSNSPNIVKEKILFYLMRATLDRKRLRWNQVGRWPGTWDEDRQKRNFIISIRLCSVCSTSSILLSAAQQVYRNERMRRFSCCLCVCVNRKTFFFL